MTILFRYLLREQTKVFVMCFAGLMTVYLVIDFFEKVRKFLRYDAEMATIIEYFALRTPAISFQIAPLAVLMATLLALGVFSKNHEITAMRSCGISLGRIAAPFLLFSLAVTLVLFIFSAVVIPHATARADRVMLTKIEKKIAAPTIKTDRSWIQIGNQTLMNFDVIESNGAVLRGISLYQLGPDFRVISMTEAKEAFFTGNRWTLHHGMQRTLLPEGVFRVDTFEETPLNLSQKPEDFKAWSLTETEEMTLKDLRAYSRRLEKDGYNVAQFATDYHGRFAFPFVSLVMAIVGMALSLRRSGVRGSGMAIGIGQALAIGFLYWGAYSVSIALGRTGALTPMLAGWLSNLLFLSFGFALFLHVRH